MPDWLESNPNVVTITPEHILVRLAMSFLLGGVIAGLYRWLRRRDPISPSFPPTLVFLSILIAMVTQVIGDNVARAFSLVGVVSIVRFRTVVRDTQDTAFVILSVVVGMAVGANHLVVALLGLLMVAIAALLMQPRRRHGHWPYENCNLLIRVARDGDCRGVVQEVFKKHIEAWEEVELATGQKGVSLEINYLVRLRKTALPMDLVTELHRIPDVEKVELKRVSE